MTLTKDFFTLLNPTELVGENKNEPYYYYCKHDDKAHYKYGMCRACYEDWTFEISL